jgi:hypothetical protein
MDAHPQMSTNDKVLTLLGEYSSLRAEIMQRNSVFNQYCVISVPASVAAVSIAYTAFPPAGIILFLVICALLYVVFRIIEFDTLAAAARVRVIEQKLNEMAGERLVSWETDCGLDQIGYRARFRYVFDPLMNFWSAALGRRPTAEALRPRKIAED